MLGGEGGVVRDCRGRCAAHRRQARSLIGLALRDFFRLRDSGNEKAPTFVEAFEDGAAPGVEIEEKFTENSSLSL